MGLVESCFVVLLRRLAHTLPRIADYQGGFYDDQAVRIRITNFIVRLSESLYLFLENKAEFYGTVLYGCGGGGERLAAG